MLVINFLPIRFCVPPGENNFVIPTTEGGGTRKRIGTKFFGVLSPVEGGTQRHFRSEELRSELRVILL